MTIEFSADEVYEMGMDIEKNGEAYYRKAAELAKDEAIKAIFVDLMEQEMEHYKTFKELRESLSGKSTAPTVADPEDQSYLYLNALVKSRLFSNEHEAEALATKVKDEMEALRAAMSFEKDTILFFLSMKDMVSDEKGKSEIDRLINEEHKHVVRISKAIDELKSR